MAVNEQLSGRMIGAGFLGWNLDSSCEPPGKFGGLH